MNSKQAVLLASLMIVTLILSSSGLGQSFQPFFVEPKSVKNDIAQNDFAEFAVTIKNIQDFEDTFRILPFEDPKWAHQIIPLDDFSFGKTIAGKGEATIRLLAKPSGLELGKYNVKLSVKSEKTGQVVDAILRINIAKLAMTLKPDFYAELLLPEQIDPRNKATVKVVLRNNNALDLTDISVVLDSRLINKQTVVSLSGIEEKAVEFTVNLDPSTPPQSDSLHVVVVHEDKTVFDDTKDYRIVEYVPPFKQDISTTKKLWKVTRTITLTNDGNVKKEDTVRLPTTTRESIFTSSTPAHKLVADGEQKFYAWRVSLGPDESTTIQLTTDYRVLALLIVVIMAGLIYYFATRKAIVVSKSVKSTKKAHGAITEARIVLHIRNRTNKPVNDVRVIERVPKIFSVKKDGFEASIHPSKIHINDHDGTVMDFHLHDLDSREERIINYTVTPKLHIFGDMPVKPTVVEYKAKGGKKKQTSKSNTLHIPCPQEEPKPEPTGEIKM
jgi:hypothetical protein